MTLLRTLVKFLLLSAVFQIVACSQDENVGYDVPVELQVYVDDFEYEAAIRGVNLDLEDLGLKISYSENPIDEDGFAGLCIYDENKIILNREYWESSIAPEKERVIFHEFGHCVLLRRGHLCDELENGDFKSMMNGTPECSDSYTNYTSNTREYYIDELFDPEVEEPDWVRPVQVTLRFYLSRGVGSQTRTIIYGHCEAGQTGATNTLLPALSDPYQYVFEFEVEMVPGCYTFYLGPESPQLDFPVNIYVRDDGSIVEINV